MSKSPKNLRRRLIINPQFQWPFIAAILQLEIVVFMLAAMITLVTDFLLLDMALLYSPHFQEIVISVVGLFLCFGALLFHIGVRLSHRISGPLYRISLVLEEIKAGRIPDPIRFRDKDFHPELADKVNAALAVLREYRDSQAHAWQAQAEQFHALAKDCEGDLAETLCELARAAEAAVADSLSDPTP